MPGSPPTARHDGVHHPLERGALASRRRAPTGTRTRARRAPRPRRARTGTRAPRRSHPVPLDVEEEVAGRRRRQPRQPAPRLERQQLVHRRVLRCAPPAAPAPGRAHLRQLLARHPLRRERPPYAAPAARACGSRAPPARAAARASPRRPARRCRPRACAPRTPATSGSRRSARPDPDTWAPDPVFAASTSGTAASRRRRTSR